MAFLYTILLNANSMPDAIPARMKGFLLNPAETFRNCRDDPAGSVLSYFAVLLIIDALLTSAIAVLGIGYLGAFLKYIPANSYYLPAVVFLIILLGGLVWALIISAWIHLWVYLVGGRKGIFSTVRAVLYGMTPGLLFGWIPVVGIFFTLWALILEIIGIRELQEISGGKAILVMIIAFLIPTLLIVLAAAWFMVSSVSTVTPVAVPPGFS